MLHLDLSSNSYHNCLLQFFCVRNYVWQGGAICIKWEFSWENTNHLFTTCLLMESLSIRNSPKTNTSKAAISERRALLFWCLHSDIEFHDRKICWAATWTGNDYAHQHSVSKYDKIFTRKWASNKQSRKQNRTKQGMLKLRHSKWGIWCVSWDTWRRDIPNIPLKGL